MSSSVRGFQEVKGALEADGHKVFVSDVPPFVGLDRRGEHLVQLVDRVLAEAGAPKVNIIAHSMGGLDARYFRSIVFGLSGRGF